MSCDYLYQSKVMVHITSQPNSMSKGHQFLRTVLSMVSVAIVISMSMQWPWIVQATSLNMPISCLATNHTSIFEREPIRANLAQSRVVAITHQKHDSRRCVARMRYPLNHVSEHSIIHLFKRPLFRWSPGNRGLDLRAHQDEPLYAPADGIIRFAGRVANKNVVSVYHGAFITTYEPAVTHLAKGAKLTRGDIFAMVSGQANHCESTCLHWGVKTSDTQEYVDPLRLVTPLAMALKHVQ